MIAACCLKSGFETGKKLFQFAAPSEARNLEQIAVRWEREGTDRASLSERIQNLSRYGRRLAFEEIHPGWILEKLRGESPRIFRLLPHFLSPSKVDSILSHLNREERDRLPAASRPVAAEVIALVQRLFEKQLGAAPTLKSDEIFSFRHLSCLKGDDLRALVRDLGMEEVVRALSGVEAQVLRAFLSRFPHREAQEIRRRVKEAEVSPEARLGAQRRILGLSFDQVAPERLFLEIGFSYLAHAVDTKEFGWAESLYRKFSVGEGYRLRRFLQERKGKGVQGEAGFKDFILARLAALARAGKIQRYWKDEREVEPTLIFREV